MGVGESHSNVNVAAVILQAYPEGWKGEQNDINCYNVGLQSLTLEVRVRDTYAGTGKHHFRFFFSFSGKKIPEVKCLIVID